MIKNTIFVLFILLSVMFTCENTNLEKKSFLRQINVKAATSKQSISNEITNYSNSNNNNTNPTSTNSNTNEDPICSEAKEYVALILEVEASLRELMIAFEEHLQDIRLYKNSTDADEEKEKWQIKEKDMVDYYINKTAELLDVHQNLNNTINQIKTTYCNQKIIKPSNNNTNPESKNNSVNPYTNNLTNTSQFNNTSNSVNNSTPYTNNTTNNTSNNTTNISTNNTTNNNSTENNKEKMNGTNIDIKYNTNTKEQEEIPKPLKTDDDTSHSGSQSNIITIFSQKLQSVASEAGLPDNYVLTRLREIKESKMKSRSLRNSRKLKH